MRLLVALPGLHRVHRGAEVALESVARGLAQRGHEVTLLGGGHTRAGEPYSFEHVGVVDRGHFERLPEVPGLRTEFAYEELTFATAALGRFRPSRYDVTMTCGYPFTNWLLRRPARKRPAHVFVTQNGDWPAWSNDREFRFFSCDGLVCTNPEYYDRNRDRWRSVLVPNGVDLDRFSPRPERPGAEGVVSGEQSGDRAALGLPTDVPIVLMVSAFMASKRIDAAVRAVAELDGVHLVVAGDGVVRAEIEALAADVMPGRFQQVSLPFEMMPTLYRSADVFLHTTLAESFGNVYVEALASGLPVVAHDGPVTRWILGDGDLLVDTEDRPALVDAIRRALKIGVGAPPADIARFSWPRVVDDYERFLTEILATR